MAPYTQGNDARAALTRYVRWAVAVCLALASVAAAAPVAYWPFDEGAGSAVHDGTGNVDRGRVGNVTWTTGRTGRGLQFGGTGSDSFVRVPDCEALRCEGSFTVQFWWQKTSDAVQIFVRKGAGSRANYYAYYEGGLHFSVSGTDGRNYSVTGATLANGWHHLAFTCDAQHLAIIADGAMVGTGDGPAARLFTDESDLLIGTFTPGYKHCLGGVLDDLCLSDTALAPDKLDAELAQARAMKPSGAAGQTTTFRPTRGALVLARDGRPGATIVVSRDASDLQTAPARELQRVIQRATGARLPLRDDDEAVTGNLVLVGESALTRQMGLPGQPLSGDAFLIKSVPGRLVLLGHDDVLGGKAANAFSPGRCKAGTSNAVQAFLHDVCGVRWFMPGKLGEVVPATPALEVSSLDRREQPAREYVLGSFASGDNGKWARRELLGSSLFIKHMGGHLWYSLIPQKQVFATHPEWFALLDGKRAGEGNHLCVTNKEMFTKAAANLKAMYAEGYEWVELGQTDGWRRCRCEQCEAQDEYRTDGWWIPGCPADRIFLFHAALAEEIRQAYPGRKVLMISYGPTGEVSHKLQRLPDNVVVEFTHDPPELLARWQRFHHDFTSYVYWFGLYHKMGYGPKSSPTHVAAEMCRHRQVGSKAFYLCGGGECWGTEAPSYYVMAELARNPGADEPALVREFCEGLFGKAGATMQRYFATFLAAADDYHAFTRAEVKPGEPYRGQARTPSEIYLHCFPEERLARCAALLTQAAAEADNDAERRRLQFFHDGFDYVRLTTRAFAAARQLEERKDEASKAALAEVLRQRAELIGRIGEHQQANGMDLPPIFRASPDDLLYGPGKAYAGVFGSVGEP
ncbi:MAG: DUF4838 domain-containing protein [Armatimonadetes bacterium]|nr:DUF4838 domain-containing protein [Armatimonadota bacterium]